MVLCGSAVPTSVEAQGVRVAGHVTILEKHRKPAGDVGDAVVYLEGGAPAAARPGAFEIATRDKEFVPRALVVPLRSTVKSPNHDPLDHNVFSVSDPHH